MATIKVNSAVMRDKAQSFTQVSSQIKNFTSEMTQQIDSLRSTWEGESAEALVNRFKGLTDNFETICKTITDYAQFLQTAAESYDAAENEIAQGAQSQRD